MTQQLAPADLAAATLRDVAESTERLLRTVVELTPEAVAEPSGLPGWTRGHVLAHIARNADSLVNLLETARTGVEIPQYASESAREEAIQQGAPRPPAEQLADLEASAERLAQAAAALSPEHWAVQLKHRLGYVFPAYEVPAKRLGELEYHHVDLLADYTPAHWPAGFAVDQFDLLAQKFSVPGLPAVALICDDIEHRAVIGDGPVTLTAEGPVRALAAWLSGRSDGDGLQVREDGGPLIDHTALPALPPMG
ncbi:maleylpyruvate isomerase family mycothiol-dependent enzyme [Kitasatospora acidiphila]|uniref:Maleylpyruvate isomerase family mycothiol-dependent enzyme n=1 Tax=Kitasatospora acidiphila TaxID=2567942 RepID=A0A540W264_9ACTN|nr:maleylpyruvate isomerase N-terminal domain-containing protein [Kitasatospora acidiphila]TQF03118.1 maleylpyruvate isomerase family mycothiol-dependent enzyme [Kitasatospora acidiphila]